MTPEEQRTEWNRQQGRLLTEDEAKAQHKRWADEEAAARYNAREDVQAWRLKVLGA